MPGILSVVEVSIEPSSSSPRGGPPPWGPIATARAPSWLLALRSVTELKRFNIDSFQSIAPGSGRVKTQRGAGIPRVRHRTSRKLGVPHPEPVQRADRARPVALPSLSGASSRGHPRPWIGGLSWQLCAVHRCSAPAPVLSAQLPRPRQVRARMTHLSPAGGGHVREQGARWRRPWPPVTAGRRSPPPHGSCALCTGVRHPHRCTAHSCRDGTAMCPCQGKRGVARSGAASGAACGGERA